ncbi:amino acid adenylation domain-containing protein [Tumebacillus permanentifrigoris]|uniref:Amino acid adenylation domain-containing protein n=1 Tax=Tumebacillus permanentifrigoris TaxID=378543 RepID=A0A316D760_9BACL|nr:non-ribosomal peptide synthetase [Tumebacillus permanentifrigoris]PWK11296.1 amino acid adenylation domain-containing protein [Tumebacillus permanentifrigoris]
MNYLSKENVLEVLELSVLQERMIADGTPHLSQYAYEVENTLDQVLLDQALQAVIAAHPEVRSVFRTLKNRTVQVLLKTRPILLEVHDLRSLTEAQRAGAEAELVTQMGTPIEIGAGPLLRFALVRHTEACTQLWVTHHDLILDEQSRTALLEDWFAVYESMVAKNAPSLSPERPRFAMYLQWLTRKDWMPAKEFWRAQAGELVPSAMFSSVRRGTGLNKRRRSVTQTLSPQLSDALRELAARAQVSDRAVAAAAWAMLAALYGGEEQVTFGWQAEGRPADVVDVARMLGSFAQLLPVSMNVAGEQILLDFLRGSEQRIQGVEAVAFLPEEEARRDAEVPDGVSMYDTSLAFSTSSDIRWTPLWEQVSSGQKPMLQLVVRAGKSWRVDWSFADDELPASTVERLQHQWHTLLESLAEANLAAPMSELRLTSAQEQSELEAFNRSELPNPDLSLLAHQVIEQQVVRTPDATAVRCGEDSMTYAELNAQANLVAWQLRDMGFGRDDVAALFAERDIEMLIGILGVLKAGGAYVPLDAANPVARNRTVVETSRAKVVLTQAPLVSESEVLIEGLETAPVLVNLSDSTPRAALSRANPPAINEPGDLANVFYTSGSTGLPKGAMVEHIGMLNHLYAKIGLLEVTSDSIVAQTASHCFDISVWQFLAPLMVGGITVIYPNAVSGDPDGLLDATERDGVTDLELVPAMIEMIWRAAQEHQKVALSSLRHLVATGEGLPSELCNRWRRLYPNVRMINAYGASETSDDFTHEVIDSWVSEDRPYVSLGTVIPHHRVYVLDRFLRDVPIGGIGEICVTGVGVGRGYLHDPERTAKAFLRNPFADGMGERLYRTGDLGYFTPDGRLAYISRADFQVKVRGHRMELGEVEGALRRHPWVDQCVALVRKDEFGQNRLLAYVVTSQKIETAELREHLKQLVPEYMIPEALIFLDRLPLNRNGKVDRKALPEPEQSDAGRTVTPPRNAAEEALVQIWQDVLKVSGLGIDHNFFELGGHSLKTIQVRARIKRQFGVDVPLHLLFEHQTIRELSTLVGDAPMEVTESWEAVIPKLPPAETYAMSHAQHRLFFMYWMDRTNVSYNMPALLELEGSLDLPALVRAFETILARHDVLRTTYEMVGGHPIQRVHELQPLHCPLLDFSMLNEQERETALWADVNAEMQTPFDLTVGPVFRMRVFRLEPNRHWLMLQLHHIVGDFWSWQVMLREFQTLYASECAGHGEALPPLTVQYTDYAAWQNERLEQGQLQAAQAYWLETLGGELPVLDLPTDHPRSAVMQSEGQQVRQPIDAELATKLQALTQQGDATLFLVLLAATGILLSRLSGQSDLVIGTPEAGRNLLELEGLVGLFINTLPLRLHVEAGQSFLNVLEQVKQRALQAYEHHEYPFDQLVEDINPVRDLSRTPIFSVMFQVLRDGDDRFPEVAGLHMRPVELDVSATKFDLQIDFVERPNTMECLFTYRTDLYERETVERWMSHLLLLLQEIVATPDAPVESLRMLEASERNRLLSEWNETDVAYSTDLCVHELFEQQVERTPDAVAVVDENETLTYRELNERTNRLANYLRTLGVAPEVRVGLCLERSVDMVVAIYAVLKAGGAYVPIDPQHPPKRIAEVVEDAELALVLTQERFQAVFSPFSLRVLTIDAVHLPWATETEVNPVLVNTPDHLLYMMYTSGSTGKPKGVMNEHHAVVNLLLWMRDQYALSSTDRMLLKTAYTFDVSVWELFLPLISGASLTIARPDGHRDLVYLKRLIEEQGITHAVFVPSALQMFVEQDGVALLTDLKNVLCIGEALSVEAQERFFRTFPNTELHNLYGPTEAAVNVTYWNCQRGDQRRYVPIGAPIANAKLYVLDERLEPVPLGVIGELFIGGTPVARGYHNRDELSAERFVSDPFSKRAGARMYRTGDSVRRHRDGSLEFLGRADDQVKLRGFRMELGDIEAALLRVPDVREAAVLLQQDEGGGVLVAYVVADARLGTADLREGLAGQLPEYMLPSRYVFLDRLPMLANDKLDRKTLRGLDPGSEAQAEPDSYVAPRTALEREMVKIFERILNVRPIGIQDDFFAAGGHSLKVLGLISEVQAVFGVALPLVNVYQRPTVAQLCEWLESANCAQTALCDGAIPIQLGDGTQPPLFFVHGQGGGISSFFLLAQALGAQTSVYGLQAFGYETSEEPLTSIGEMADRYVEEIRRVAAHGPYRIAGWSFGGTVAFEVARRLEQLGEHVDWLGLFDAHPMDLPGDLREKQAWTETDVLRFALSDLGLEPMALDGLTDSEAFTYVVQQLERAGRVPRGLPEASLRAKLNTMAAHGTAAAFYRYEGPVQADLHLYRVTEVSAQGHSLVEVEEWRPRTTGSLWVHPVQGDHNSMLDVAHVTALADKMKELATMRRGC